MFTGPMEDRLAIRELHDTYSDAVLRVDADDWGSTWAEEAHWNLMGTPVEGREAIVGLWTQAMQGFKAVSFLSAPSAIEINGDTAKGRCQTHEIMVMADGTSRAVGGRYDDEFVKRDGKWLYSKRVFVIQAEYNAKEA